MSNIDISQMLPVGTMLDGRYRIERYLASGGFGNTYVAIDTKLDCIVAIKEFYLKEYSTRGKDKRKVENTTATAREYFDSYREKFVTEAKRISKLKSEHIVRVTDRFDANGTSYYVMDYIEGISLKQLIEKGHFETGIILDDAKALDITSQLVDALEVVHAAGLYHLDITPNNVMLTPAGKAILIDFGASKQMNASGGATQHSLMVHTPGYAPSEQIDQRADRIGPWTDFYALGATLYAMIEGNTPPSVSDITDEGWDAFNFHDWVIGENAPEAVYFMMRPSTKKRPQNCEEVRALLKGEKFVDELPWHWKDGESPKLMKKEEHQPAGTPTNNDGILYHQPDHIDGAISSRFERMGDASMTDRTSEVSQETKILDNKQTETLAHVNEPPEDRSNNKKLWITLAVSACLGLGIYFLVTGTQIIPASFADTWSEESNESENQDSFSADTVVSTEAIDDETESVTEVAEETLNVVPTFSEIGQLVDKIIYKENPISFDPVTAMKKIDKTSISNMSYCSYGKNVTMTKGQIDESDYDFYYYPTSDHAVYLQYLIQGSGGYVTIEVGFNNKSDADAFNSQRNSNHSTKGLAKMRFDSKKQNNGWYVYIFENW